MTKGIVASEMNVSTSGFLPSKLSGKAGRVSSASQVRGLRRDPAHGEYGRVAAQSLLGGILDPKSSSSPLRALARAAAISGKRLVLEIRDENPVRIIRTSTRGM
jgi:hypothetical protein